jgi:type I restriction enzyme S subunit
MSYKWQMVSIGEIGKVVTGKTPSTSTDSYYGGDYPFYTPSDMDGRKRMDATKRTLSSEGIGSIRGSIIEAGAIMVSCIGSDMGKVAIAARKGATNQQINSITVFQGIDPEYIYYELSTRKDELQMLATGGSAQPILNKGHFSQIEICIPPLPEQKAIAHIFGTLDDKIELNRKTNEALEAMAKALFKSWFVDFEPVRAKAEGRPTGLPAVISDLFPDSFKDSELGEIPSGWRVGTIASSVGEVFDGPHATPKEAEEGNVFLGIKNMTGSSLNLSDVKLIGHDDWSQWTRRVEPRADDIVFTYEAALGLFAVIPHGLKCCLGRRMALIRTKATNGSPHFWFHQFIAKPFQKVIEERSIHGATVNRTPLTEFPGYPILEPPETLRLAFDHAASSLWARIHAASNQTSSLTSLRDALLPKLISGEIRIPDAEKMLEEVGI